MKPERQVKRTITTNISVPLSGADIIKLLRGEGPTFPDVPDNATVQFAVPSGGDYSGMDLPIDEHEPVTVKWTTTVQS